MLRLVWLFSFKFPHAQPLNCDISPNLMLASSKVEIASSASPFGCVLRDRNWREPINRSSREKGNNVETAFQTRIKYFVQDHDLHADPTPQKNPQNAGEWLVNHYNSTIIDETRQSGSRKRDVSPNSSNDSSIDTQDPGFVSSLVQRWREFSDTRPITKKQCNPNSPSSSSSPSSNADPGYALGKSSNYHENVSSVTPKTTCDSIGEKFDTPCNEKFDNPVAILVDTFFYSDSDRVVQTGPPSAQSLNSEDGGERERLRVADVIKKLKLEKASMGNGTESKMKEQEKRCSSPVISSSPRIRGRQAFNDLLMQFERDRHLELDTLVERRAVSKFSHRGRIQSLLRLRCMRRDAIVRHHHQQQNSRLVAPQQHSHPNPVPGLQQPSSCEESNIVDSPQITSSGSIGIDAQRTEAISRKQQQSFSKSVEEQNSSCEATSIDGQRSQSLPSEPNQMGQGSSTVVLLREKFNVLGKIEAATPKSPRAVAKGYIQCIKSSSTSNQHKEELRQQEVEAHTAHTSCSSQESILKEKEVSSPNSDSLLQKTNYEVDNTFSLESGKSLTISNGSELSKNLEEHDQNNSPSLQQETSYKVDNICLPDFEKTFSISNEWEHIKNPEEDDQNNLESNDQQMLESGEEWRSNDTHSWTEWDDEYTSNLNWVSDIARPKRDWENLRQARYRDMLDSDQENDEVRQLLERRSVSTFLTSSLRGTMDQLMISRVERVPQSMEYHHEHRLEQYVVSQIKTQANKRIEEQDEGGDSNFSDLVRYPSFEQPQSSQSSCQDTQPFSALTNHSSTDMDYMYDLRSYMEQLQQEVSELRKTVNSCMNMQEKMQSSIKREVAAAIDSSVRRAGPGSADNILRTRSCCLCYEMQVDSLLYRCGHMCTCFKCAHELQWSTGKCPICGAPIIDVVRVYPEVKSFTGDEPNSCTDDSP